MPNFQSSLFPGGGLSHGQLAKTNARLVHSRVARIGKASSAGSVEPEDSASMGLRDEQKKERRWESISPGDGCGVRGLRNKSDGSNAVEDGMLSQTLFEVQIVDPKPTCTSDEQKDREFYANVGKAVETLKEETPYLFQKDLTCEC